jgi:hypothetical protein
VAHYIAFNEAADPSRKAVRDDSIFDHPTPVIPNPALSGEESAVAYTLITAADYATPADGGRAAVDRMRECREVVCSRHQPETEYRKLFHRHPIPATLHVLLMHAC